jgi:ribonuclease PH
MGNTHVLCAATIEETVPPHLKGSNTGWVTAEYSLLPRATFKRTRRERGTIISGRTQEIQRLIGRSLRSVTDLAALGERTVIIDCDVIKADGGTRTASITGAFIALALAATHCKRQINLSRKILFHFLASVSVGIVNDEPRLDLCYEEDFKASVDMNVVMVDSGDLVEVQGSGEEATFSRKEHDILLDLAHSGIIDLIKEQNKIIKQLP